MKVLSVYLQKHISSLFNYLKTEKEYAESIEGRIMDIINYLLLLPLHDKKKRERRKMKGKFIKVMELVRQTILGKETISKPARKKRKYKKRTEVK